MNALTAVTFKRYEDSIFVYLEFGGLLTKELVLDRGAECMVIVEQLRQLADAIEEQNNE